MTVTRLEALRHTMRSGRVDALLITHLPLVRYLTGFSGSNAVLLVTHRSLLLATDPRYATQGGQEVLNADIIVTHEPLAESVFRHVRLRKNARIGFEKSRTTVALYERLRRVRKGLRWVSVDGTLESHFTVRTEEEIASIRKAAAISDDVFAELLDWIRPGMRESDIAAEISYRQRRKGGEGDAFEPIVASGVRGALPHARAGAKNIRRGELVTLDFGCIVNGFCSDLTRTVAVGSVSQKLRTVYEAVLAAQLVALSAIRHGVSGRAADAEARRVLRKRRLAQWFRHSLGHGLGIEVHEAPRLAPRSVDTLREGNVVTVEPGVYIPGVGGVRIEDDVLVTQTGIELLTRSPKGLIVL